MSTATLLLLNTLSFKKTNIGPLLAMDTVVGVVHGVVPENKVGPVANFNSIPEGTTAGLKTAVHKANNFNEVVAMEFGSIVKDKVAVLKVNNLVNDHGAVNFNTFISHQNPELVITEVFGLTGFSEHQGICYRYN
jgi:hypothetical protein